jgi:hypothetical protein
VGAINEPATEITVLSFANPTKTRFVKVVAVVTLNGLSFWDYFSLAHEALDASRPPQISAASHGYLDGGNASGNRWP